MGGEERLSIFQLCTQLLVFLLDRFPLVFGGCDHLIRFFKECGGQVLQFLFNIFFVLLNPCAMDSLIDKFGFQTRQLIVNITPFGQDADGHVIPKLFILQLHHL
jgi:hypothetical protein